MLDEEFLKPLGLTKYRLAKDIGAPLNESAISWPASGPSRQTPTGAFLFGVVWCE